MEIRTMTAKDLDRVAQMEQLIFSTPWTKQGFFDALQLSNTCYLVAEEEGEICGYCGFYQSFEEAEIVNVAVASAYRKQGIGRKLLKELFLEGKQRGVGRFFLEVRVSNKAAVSLYQSVGFVLDGTRRGFYDKPKEDAFLFSKICE